MKTFLFSTTLLATFATAAFTWAAEVSITLPAETTTLKPGPGAELVQANCLVCHSADYIQYQPVMGRKFWDAEVKKMREKYAAPISDDTVAAKIAEYLTASYGLADAPK